MKYTLVILLLAGIISLNPNRAKAQDTISGKTEMVFDINSIPPLIVMIDSAIAHNAMLKYYENGIVARKYSLAADQKSWTKNFGIQADIRYGTFDNFSTNTAEGQNPALIATRTTQTNYGVGAFLKLPLADFMNHKNLVNLAKTEVEQARSMAEVQRNEIRQIVIKQYNELLLKQTLLKIKTKSFESARVNLMMAEKEYQNGVIPLGTYSNMSAVVSDAEISFEEAKTDFRTALMLLEEVVGFKFNLKIQ